jgi:5-methylcytosine-specific restriction endonuclease McrA
MQPVQKRADPFYQSPAWKTLRAQAIRRDGWCCVVCRASVRAKGAARVDHIKPRREFPELALALSNVRTLCINCDAKRHAEKGGRVYGAALDGTPLDPDHPWNKRP